MVVIFPPVFLSFSRRTCSKCGNTQLVAKKNDKIAVNCKKCGNSIPPKSS